MRALFAHKAAGIAPSYRHHIGYMFLPSAAYAYWKIAACTRFGKYTESCHETSPALRAFIAALNTRQHWRPHAAAYR